jgi:hypothetical protein
MKLQEELERLVASPIEDAAGAERAREAAGILAEYLRLRDRADRLLSPMEDAERGAGQLAGLTLHAAAERVLQEAGTPLHARELGARIKAGGWRHPRSKVARPEQIVHQLAARLPRHPQMFRRVAPQTFALAKWGDDGFPARPGIRPRLSLFDGPGEAIAAKIGDSDEHLSGRGASWRSS